MTNNNNNNNNIVCDTIATLYYHLLITVNKLTLAMHKCVWSCNRLSDTDLRRLKCKLLNKKPLDDYKNECNWQYWVYWHYDIH